MRLGVYAACDPGLVRDRNEDMLLIQDMFVRDRYVEAEIDTDKNPLWFFAVADGLGGAAAGEVASELALRLYRDAVLSLEPALSAGKLRNFFTDLAREVHRILTETGEKDPAKRGMGTTLTGLLLYSGSWYWLNIGDSRAYRFRGRELSQLSRDHTLRELTGRADIPSNYLANCLGAGAEAFCDFGVIPDFSSEVDRLLLSSDGLHDLIGNEHLESLLRTHPEDPVESLVEAAKAAGGRDNISCIYIKPLAQTERKSV